MVDQVPNGAQTFLDQNGDPLAAGLVYMYLPNTTTLANTWSDAAGTILNTNPIVLDQAGRAEIWGNGLYRQEVHDQFGNIQWNLNTQAGVGGTVSGNLSVTGTLTAGQVTANGITSNGSLNVGGEAIVNGGMVVNAASGQTQALQLNGTLGIATPNGSADFFLGDKILMRSPNAPGIAFANTTDNLTMGWFEGGNALVSAIFDGNGNPIQNFAFIPGTGGNAGGVITTGRIFMTQSGLSPAFCCFNTADGIAWNMQASSGVLQWGSADSNGNLQNELMKLDGAGTLTITGNFMPFGVTTIGTTAGPWNAMYAHAFNTVSTDATSDPLPDKQLEVVKDIPVKTLPHIGISAKEAQVIEGAVTEDGIGTNYAVLVGVLWKALQELSVETELLRQQFESYVISRP